MRKIIISLFLLFIHFFAYSSIDNKAPANIPVGLSEYISDLVHQTSSMLNNPNLSKEIKISKARSLMNDNLDFDWMANYTIGTKGRKALSAEQKKEFVKVYSKYVTKAYTDLIKDYKGQKPQITAVRPITETEFMVSMNISREGQESVKVEYLVREMKNGEKDVFKVSDIITENVSLLEAQQQEFMNTLDNEGFDKLVQNLKARS
jgi:phospholipid transport system substrate-binding protein